MVDERVEKAKKLAVAVITQSVARAKEGDAFEVAWLGSKRAEKWLDVIDIPQSSMLAKIGWMDWAPAHTGDPTYGKVISATLTYMEDLLHV